MTWAVPTWYALVLLALAAFRTWRLLAEDTILDWPRVWVLTKVSKGEAWLLCAWCCGFWVSVAWWLAWIAWPHWSLIACTPLALSSVVGFLANLEPDD